MYQSVKASYQNFILFTFFLLLLTAGGFFFLYAANAWPQFFMPCTLKAVFHLYCPGCGGTHALSELLHLHPVRAFCYNPLVPYGAAVTAYYWIRLFIRMVREKGQGVYRMNLAFIWGLLILMAAIFLIRNLLLVLGVYDYSGELIGFWPRK